MKNEMDMVNPDQVKFMTENGFTFAGIVDTGDYVRSETETEKCAIWVLYTSGPMAIRLRLHILVWLPMCRDKLFEYIYHFGAANAEVLMKIRL